MALAPNTGYGLLNPGTTLPNPPPNQGYGDLNPGTTNPPQPTFGQPPPADNSGGGSSGPDATTLANFSAELYAAIRTIDKQHVVILPGHNQAGIDAYGDPKQRGMQNVAFEMHFYPGFWATRR